MALLHPRAYVLVAAKTRAHETGAPRVIRVEDVRPGMLLRSGASALACVLIADTVVFEAPAPLFYGGVGAETLVLDRGTSLWVPAVYHPVLSAIPVPLDAPAACRVCTIGGLHIDVWPCSPDTLFAFSDVHSVAASPLIR